MELTKEQKLSLVELSGLIYNSVWDSICISISDSPKSGIPLESYDPMNSEAQLIQLWDKLDNDRKGDVMINLGVASLFSDGVKIPDLDKAIMFANMMIFNFDKFSKSVIEIALRYASALKNEKESFIV